GAQAGDGVGVLQAERRLRELVRRERGEQLAVLVDLQLLDVGEVDLGAEQAGGQAGRVRHVDRRVVEPGVVERVEHGVVPAAAGFYAQRADVRVDAAV